jgi:hypothetical protein
MNESFFPMNHHAFIACIALLAGSLGLVAQEEANEEFLPPLAPTISIPPESYTFMMKVPPGTDCSVRMRLTGRKPDRPAAAGAGEEEQLPADADSDLDLLRIHRKFRTGITASQHVGTDRSETSYYFVKGWCAFDSPQLGLNVRRYLEGNELADLSVYHFPELLWAVPATRQPDPPVAEGKPAIHIYTDGGAILEVDAASGLPLRFTDGTTEWRYSYRQSSDPIAVPEQIRKALATALRATGDLTP